MLLKEDIKHNIWLIACKFTKFFPIRKEISIFLLLFPRNSLTLHAEKLLYLMEQTFELIAKTFMGLEPVLAKELTQLGANDVQIGRRMVSFTGDKEMMYRANFQLHTAIKILKPIHRFKAGSADDVYEEIKKIDWTE